MVAAWEGSLKTARKLLEAGAEVHIMSHYHRNALHLAVMADRHDVVALLVAKIAKRVNSASCTICTTLHFGAWKGFRLAS